MKSKFSILQYSISAAALLQGAAAFSQAIYTDVDPDIILDEPGESWGFDLDADGLNDFNFFNKSFTTTVFYMDQANVKALFAGAFDTMQNGINGSAFTLSGGYYYVRPYAIQQSELIGDSDNFYNDNYQSLVNIIDNLSSPFEPFHEGNWYYFYGEEVLNKYLGFRFTDEEAVQRYGWIRCSVIDSGRTLIIHDYAYESKPDTPILTGDTIGDTTTVAIENIHTLNAAIYSFGRKIFISVSDFEDAIVTISNLQGMTLIKKEIQQDRNVIDMDNYSSGIYLVTIKSADKIYSKKVFIN